MIVALATSGVFTFGLFFATGVFPLGPILAELKIGAVATGIGVPLAFGAAWLLRAGRFAHHGHSPHHAHATGHAHARIAIMFVLALFGSCGIASAQHGAPHDDDLRQAIAGRLADKGIDDIDVSVTRSVVTLRGRVRTLWLKDWAVEHALDVDGVTAVFTELTIPHAESDGRLAEQVSERLRRYVFFSIFDDAEVEVDDGIVTLTGRVTMPQKTDALADLAARVAGVQLIRNGIRTLPVSQSDDRLRYIIARQIYEHPVFSPYAILIDPPVHIIVEHGAVTLTGVVDSEVEQRTAEVIARMALGVMSVTNELRLADED